MMQLARSTIKIGLGRIGEGWDDYEARLEPLFAGSTLFLIDRPPGRRRRRSRASICCVMGEQGLGDEVLFANMLPDVLEALGPDGKLTLRRRAAPGPTVPALVPHRRGGRRTSPTASTAATCARAPALGDVSRFDLWVPLASLLRRFRRRLEDFPGRERFLMPDPGPRRPTGGRCSPAAPAGRKVGILWKSMKLDFAPVALLFAVPAVGAGAEDAGRHHRQHPVRRLRARDRLGRARARRRDLDPARHRPEAGPRRPWRAHLCARRDASASPTPPPTSPPPAARRPGSSPRPAPGPSSAPTACPGTRRPASSIRRPSGAGKRPWPASPRRSRPADGAERAAAAERFAVSDEEYRRSPTS